jgi:hypothetical protein
VCDGDVGLGGMMSTSASDCFAASITFDGDTDDTVVVPVPPTELAPQSNLSSFGRGSLPIQLRGLCDMRAGERVAALDRYLQTRSEQTDPTSAAGRFQTRFLERAQWPGFRKEADNPYVHRDVPSLVCELV